MTTTKNNIGKKATVVSNTSGHNMPIGSTVTISSQVNGQYRIKENINIYFFLTDLKVQPLTKEDIEKRILELESEITSERNKLQFMSENGFEEYDENEFKVFKTLKTLDDATLSQIEKAKLIAGLIN